MTPTLWEQLRSWMSGAGILLPESMDQTIILGAWNAETLYFVIHQSHYIVIKTLYLSKETGQPLHGYIGIKNFIKRMEINAAFNRDKIDNHYKKWDKLVPVL